LPDWYYYGISCALGRFHLRIEYSDNLACHLELSVLDGSSNSFLSSRHNLGRCDWWACVGRGNWSHRWSIHRLAAERSDHIDRKRVARAVYRLVRSKVATSLGGNGCLVSDTSAMDLCHGNLRTRCASGCDAAYSCFAHDGGHCLRCDSRLSSEPPSRWSLSFPQLRCKAGMTEKKTRSDIKMIRSAVKFHGHLGPFLVLGLRMGLAAVQTLRPHGLHDLSATVWSSRNPPQSCAIDGIQFSSGCTLGKGNIRVRSSPMLRASFRTRKKSIIVKPTDKINRMLSTLPKNETQARLRARSIRISKIPDKDLIMVTGSHQPQ